MTEFFMRKRKFQAYRLKLACNMLMITKKLFSVLLIIFIQLRVVCTWSDSEQL